MRRLLVLVCLLVSSPAWAVYTPITGLATYESDMTTYATTWCHVSDPTYVNISSSTDANPIVITTSGAHGLTGSGTGTSRVESHLTNVAANGNWHHTFISSTTFSIPHAGSGAGPGGATGQVLNNIDAAGVTFNALNYDAIAAFHNIAIYTGDPSWYTCSDGHKATFHAWAEAFSYGIQNFQKYSQGELFDYQRTGDVRSYNYVTGVAHTGYASEAFGFNDFNNNVLAREAALTGLAIANEELIGFAHRAALDTIVDKVIGTGGLFDQVVAETSLVKYDVDSQNYPGFSLFMAGDDVIFLATGAYRVVPNALMIHQSKRVLDKMWDIAWNKQTTNGFDYQFFWTSTPLGSRRGDCTPQFSSNPCSNTDAQLNQLISPSYAWMYLKTLDTTYRDRFNSIFSGGVAGSLSSTTEKLFNQKYIWSTWGVQWYNAAELALNTNARNHPVVTNRPVATATRAVTNRPAKTAWHVW